MPLLAYNEMHSPIRMSGGSFLIWPLWHAGIMDISTDEVQRFVVRNLRSIGDTMGIQQANVLADLVEGRSDIEVWKEGDPPHANPDYIWCKFWRVMDGAPKEHRIQEFYGKRLHNDDDENLEWYERRVQLQLEMQGQPILHNPWIPGQADRQVKSQIVWVESLPIWGNIWFGTRHFIWISCSFESLAIWSKPWDEEDGHGKPFLWEYRFRRRVIELEKDVCIASIRS